MNRPFYHVFIILLTLIFMGASAPVYAQQPTQQDLKTVEKRMEAERRAKEQAEKKAREAEKDLSKTQEKLVKAAAKAKEIEQKLYETEQKIGELTTEKETLNTTLFEEKKHLADLTLALQRLARTPPEALIAKPNAPIQSARTSLILKSTLPAIEEKSKLIGEMITRLETIEDDLSKRQKDLSRQSRDLEDEQKDLKKLVAERQKLYSKLHSESQLSQKKLAELSQKASSLKDLLSHIDREQEKIKKLGTPGAKPALARAAPTPKVDPKDIVTSGLPVAGSIQTAFGQKNMHGVTNKGLEIGARPGSTVTTPLGGVVKFAGPFKSYRNIVIIEHYDNTMGLIGGLRDITVQTGSTVQSGEPIGVVGGHGGESSMIYFEIRKNGQQIDPRKHLAKFSKRA